MSNGDEIYSPVERIGNAMRLMSTAPDDRIFETEPKKYFDLVKRKLKEPLDGWWRYVTPIYWTQQ